jgi:hypothetical protein
MAIYAGGIRSRLERLTPPDQIVFPPDQWEDLLFEEPEKGRA